MTPLHEGVSVPDVDAAAAWYARVFGFEKISDDFAPPLNARIVFLRLGDFELELFQYLGPDAKPLPAERRTPNEDLKTCGVKHVAWRVADMDAEYARLAALGVDVVMPPFPMGDDKVCFIRDVSGALLELIEKPVK